MPVISSIPDVIYRMITALERQYKYVYYSTAHGHNYLYDGFKDIIAAGNQPIDVDGYLLTNGFGRQAEWLFGYIGYSVAQLLGGAVDNNPELIGLPRSSFFVAEFVAEVNEDCLSVCKGNIPIFDTYDGLKLVQRDGGPNTWRVELLEDAQVFDYSLPDADFFRYVSEAEYLNVIERLKHYIEEGDIYEINYCVPFKARFSAVPKPSALLKALCSKSAMPFSGLYICPEGVVVSASPERFLKKEGRKLISQPIKGTAKRNMADAKADSDIVAALLGSEKERAENLMITDLVRNDLARSSVPGSVAVEELFGIYSYSTVHQMVSTVTSQMRDDVCIWEAIKYAFPMGSMTGAPKTRCLEIIAEVEQYKRGAYSGAMGYITPDNDFDFNVLIRSLFMTKGSCDVYFCAGGAITYDANAKEEFFEVELKIAAVRAALNI